MRERPGYLDAEDLQELQQRYADAGRLTWKLYLAVSRRAKGK
jgi:hypothetical protein